jgi:hypothetical protein
MSSMKKFFRRLILSVILTSSILTGCQSAIEKAARNTGYSAYELIGIHKRQLLKARVDDARDEQKEAGKTFQDALGQLKSLYGFKGGELEKHYDSLKSAFNRASFQAENVHKSIKKVETVAGDLFEEWTKEIDQIETVSLKNKSRETLVETQHRYGEMLASLKASESRMDPVLKKLNDQVLFLKHNLNAQAIASLKGETVHIQGEIETLINELNKSISSADKFIQQLP